jgi:hypothetical protein
VTLHTHAHVNGGQAEGLACAVPVARTPIGVSGNSLALLEQMSCWGNMIPFLFFNLLKINKTEDH